MQVLLRKNLLLMALMFASAAGAVALKPSLRATGPGRHANYEQVVPHAFGTWREIKSDVITADDPQQQQALDQIYSQVVTRSYQDATTGEVVMLEIAYGEKQNKQSQVHLPEVCYPAQGFQIDRRIQERVATVYGKLQVVRLDTVRGDRREPVTYWIRIGDDVVGGGMEQKLAVISQGLSGRIADGLLFRVSSINVDANVAYRLQDKFVTDLLAAVPSSERWLLIGGRRRGNA